MVSVPDVGRKGAHMFTSEGKKGKGGFVKGMEAWKGAYMKCRREARLQMRRNRCMRG